MIVDQVRITRIIDVGIVNDPSAAAQVALADGYGPIQVSVDYAFPGELLLEGDMADAVLDALLLEGDMESGLLLLEGDMA